MTQHCIDAAFLRFLITGYPLVHLGERMPYFLFPSGMLFAVRFRMDFVLGFSEWRFSSGFRAGRLTSLLAEITFFFLLIIDV